MKNSDTMLDMTPDELYWLGQMAEQFDVIAWESASREEADRSDIEIIASVCAKVGATVRNLP